MAGCYWDRRPARRAQPAGRAAPGGRRAVSSGAGRPTRSAPTSHGPGHGPAQALPRARRPVPFGHDRPGGAGVDLELRAGRCLALVGESGCGKSTLARLLHPAGGADSGSITLNGRELTGARRRRDAGHPAADPDGLPGPVLLAQSAAVGRRDRRRAADRAQGRATGPSGYAACSPAWDSTRRAGVRFPGEFSGGQRQRIGIARALALEPQTIVLDEPVSALDVSIQASVLNLLRDLQRKQNMAYLFIAHDLAVVRQVADDVAVMYLGVIVEQGPADQIYSAACASVHERAAVGGAGARPGQGARQAADPAQRRGTEPGQPAVWLPVPHPVLEGRRALRRGDPAAGHDRDRRGPRSRLPLPGEPGHGPPPAEDAS